MDQIFTLFIVDDQHMKVFLCSRIYISKNDHQSSHRCLIFAGQCPIFARRFDLIGIFRRL